jgi:hypothetical protein
MTSEKVIKAMRDPVTIEYRGTKYSFIDFDTFGAPGQEIGFFAKIAKYKQQGAVGVVHEAQHASAETEVLNLIDAASSFVYLPSFSGFGLAAVAMPLVMLAFNYKEGFDMLSLSGTRKLLIEWPDYAALKGRELAAFAWCVLGTLACMFAVWMVATDHAPQLGVAIMRGGLLAAAIATATIGLARFALREILGE